MECPFDGRCRWCKVVLHRRANTKPTSLSVSLHCDDTIAVARHKVAAAIGAPVSSVVMWTWLNASQVPSRAFAKAIVDSAKDASDTSLSNILSAWTRGVGISPHDIAMARREGSTEGAWSVRSAEAVQTILKRSEKDDAQVACILGARIRGMLPPTPNPFDTPVKIDRRLVGPGGMHRIGSLSIDVDAEADCLEEVLPIVETEIEAATFEESSIDMDVVSGHFVRWFPLTALSSNDQGRVLQPVVAHADRSIDNAHSLLPGVIMAVSGNIAVNRLVLNIRAYATTTAATDSGAGALMLATIFSQLKLSRATGCIAAKLFNGSSTSFRVNHTTIADVDAAVMRRWATPVIVKGTTTRPKLWVYSPLATIIIGTDLSVHAYVNTPGVQEHDADTWIRGRIEAINSTTMTAINAAAAPGFGHFDVAGSSVTCVLHLRSEGSNALSAPKASAFASVIEERLSAFFVVLAETPSICLLYKRSGSSTSRKNASDLVRLMRSRSPEAVQRELVTMFGMMPSVAASFYSAQMASWDDGGGVSVWSSVSGCALMRYLDFAPSVQVTRDGAAGIRVVMSDVRSMRMARRIMQLLQLAFSMASRNGIAHDSMPAAVEVVVDKTVAHEPRSIRGTDEPSDLDALLEDDDNNAPPEISPMDDVITQQEDQTSRDYLLEQLQRADGDLFRHKSTEYATNCGHNQGRQPVVVTREELAKIDREFPGSHSGAIIDYGSSPEKAERNAYICPKVWCPKSRVALSLEQFESLGRRCPYPGVDEDPVTFDTKYFDGKGRYPGLLDGHKHPMKLCMPCCFIKPGVRVGQCGAKMTTTMASSKSQSNAGEGNNNIRDSKYIRGDVVPLQPGRFGMMPPDIVSAFGAVRCGNREDGSGQLMNQSNCYVRCGVQVSPQNFLTALAHALTSSGETSYVKLVDTIRANLDVQEFVTLSGGRLCRTFMNGLSPVASARNPEFVRWYTGSGPSSAESYLRKFGIRNHKGKVDDSDKAVLRDALVWAAMVRYLEWLANDAEVKTHSGSGLLELASRPLPWINPSRVNLILIERPTPDGDSVESSSRTRSYVVCPEGAPSSHWRLTDPVAILIRQGSHYEPVASVQMTSSGIVQNTHLSPESISSLSSTVRILLQACGGLRRGTIGLALALLAERGHAANRQVINYAFRMVGVLTQTNLFVPISWDQPMPILVGGTGSRMGLVYLSDIGIEPTEVSAVHAELLLRDLARHVPLPGIEPAEQIMGSTALRLANGAIVPVSGFDVHSPVYLPTLNTVVNIEPGVDARTRKVRDDAVRYAAEDAIRTNFSHAMLASPEISREVVSLRSPHHPLSIDDRRTIACKLIMREHMGNGTLDKYKVLALADKLLFHPRPLQPPLKYTIGSDTQVDVELLSDVELASGVIEILIAKHVVTSHPTPSRRLFRRASIVPGPPYVQTDLIPVVHVIDMIGVNGKSSSASSSHRSRKMNSKRPLRVFLVDPFIVIHLAHRMIHPDAHVPFASVVQMVQERLASSLRPGADAARPTDGTLQALIARNVAHEPIVEAVAERGVGYVTSTFEIQCLSDILNVPIKLTPPADSTITASDLATKGFLTPLKPSHTHYLTLSERSDGIGHDLVMPPLVKNVGHGLLFPIHTNPPPRT